MSGNDCWNRVCFSCCWKADNELADVTGREGSWCWRWPTRCTPQHFRLIGIELQSIDCIHLGSSSSIFISPREKWGRRRLTPSHDPEGPLSCQEHRSRRSACRWRKDVIMWTRGQISLMSTSCRRSAVESRKSIGHGSRMRQQQTRCLYSGQGTADGPYR